MIGVDEEFLTVQVTSKMDFINLKKFIFILEHCEAQRPLHQVKEVVGSDMAEGGVAQTSFIEAPPPRPF